MTGSDDEQSADSAARVLRSVRDKGVRVWLKDGRLHVKAPGNVLTDEDRRKLKACGRQVAVVLAKESDLQTVEVELETPVQLRAPLTFSQLAHWRLYRLGERRSMRSLASAFRLRGAFDSEAFDKSLDVLFRRHDALRTRITLREGTPEQHVGRSGHCRIAVNDLSECLPDRRDAEVRRRIEQLLLEPVDVTRDPLLAVQVLNLSAAEHVVIVAVEHIIADGVSLRILMRDLLTAYAHVVRGQPVSLPIIETQFCDHAVWQRSAHEAWLNSHATYWRERLQGCQRLRWPTDIEPADTEVAGQHRCGWDAAPIRIGSALRMRLQDWSRSRGTTAPILVFTAFVAVVLRWCNAPEAVFQFVTDGRTDPGVEHTIGYFAAPLLLRLELRGTDHLRDLMERIVVQYVEARQHADFSYIESQEPRPQFTCNSIFNWMAQEQGDRAATTRDGAVTTEPFPFEHPILRNFERDNEPALLLVDDGNEIAGFLQFRRDRHSARSMQTVGRHLLSCIEQIGAEQG